MSHTGSNTVLQPGYLLAGDRFQVQRLLQETTSFYQYECLDLYENKPVTIQVISEALCLSSVDVNAVQHAINMAMQTRLAGIIPTFGSGRMPTGEIFVVSEYVAAPSLQYVVAEHRRTGQRIGIRDAFAVLTHLVAILKEVHRHSFHGVVIPSFIYLNRGVLLLANFGIGAQLAAIEARNLRSGTFVDSVFVTPGMLEMPEMVSSIDDVYSLGMIVVDLLCPQGLPQQREQATRQAHAFLESLPVDLGKTLSSAIAPQVTHRQKTVDQFLQEFERAAIKVDKHLYSDPQPGSLPIKAIRVAQADDDLFDIPDFDVPDADSGDGQYLLQINGLDYGPFSKEEVLKKLYADEVDEYTDVLDRTTQERMRLMESPVFREAVEAYVPQRNERLRLAAEARERNIQRVKSGGIGIFVVGIVASALILSVLGYFLYKLPDPQPLPVAIAFPKQDFVFSPPPKEFVAVAVDKDFLNLLFNPKASDEEIAKRYKKKVGRKKGGKRAGDSDENITEIDLSQTGGTKHILTDGEVNDVVMSDFSAIRRCIMTQLKKEPGFKGITVLFFVRPSGTTGGVKIKESKYQSSPVGQCIVGRIRNLRFPEHGGFNRSVAFPFNIQ